jgi:flagellar basal body rod protein FlgB
MKKFKIGFSLVLIPTLGMIMSALLVTIFSTNMNIANADSFPFSSPPLSPLQSQLQQQQQPLDTNGTKMTRNSNEQQIMHHPFPFFPQQSASLQPQLPPYQQQENLPQQQSLDTNGMSNIHNKSDNHSPTISLLPF